MVPWELKRKRGPTQVSDDEGEGEEQKDEEEVAAIVSSKSYLRDLHRMGVSASSGPGRRLRAFHMELATLKKMKKEELVELLDWTDQIDPHKNIPRSIAIMARFLQVCPHVIMFACACAYACS